MELQDKAGKAQPHDFTHQFEIQPQVGQFQPDEGFFAPEKGDGPQSGEKLGDDGGQSCAPHTHVQDKDEDRI